MFLCCASIPIYDALESLSYVVFFTAWLHSISRNVYAPNSSNCISHLKPIFVLKSSLLKKIAEI